MPRRINQQATLDLVKQARRLFSRVIMRLEDKDDFACNLERRIRIAELKTLKAFIEHKVATQKGRKYVAILLEYLAQDYEEDVDLLAEIMLLRNKIYPEIPMRPWDVGNVMR